MIEIRPFIAVFAAVCFGMTLKYELAKRRESEVEEIEPLKQKSNNWFMWGLAACTVLWIGM